jgi:hypothetical protein
MVVHYIEMDDVGTGGNDIADFLAQTGEIGRKNAGSDAIVRHDRQE